MSTTDRAIELAERHLTDAPPATRPDASSYLADAKRVAATAPKFALKLALKSLNKSVGGKHPAFLEAAGMGSAS